MVLKENISNYLHLRTQWKLNELFFMLLQKMYGLQKAS